MIKRIIRKIRTFRSKNSSGYPLIHIEDLNSINLPKIKFKIQNDIENFRLKMWGGEEEYVKSIIYSLEENDVFLDVGSSVGLISCIAALKVKRGLVISIEPDPENYQVLLNNFKINNINNFKALPIAVSNSNGQMDLYTAGSNGFSPSFKSVNGIDRVIQVNVFTIDSLIENKQIISPTVIKIDIEGAEMLALKGMKTLLSGEKAPRLLFIEIHPKFLNAFNTSFDEIIDFLLRLNYCIVELIEREDQILCKLEK